MSVNQKLRYLVSLSVALLLATPARAAEALIAVAANFAGAVEAIGAEFSKLTGHRLQITTGSTGKLYAQITEGAPFAVLLSADAKTPQKLEADGLVVPGSRFTYALGKLSLWSAETNRIGADPVVALKASETLHIAIANPDLAPYGVAARETLKSLGVWDELQPKIVMGQNIGQAFSMVDTGAAEVGLIATSAIEGPGIEVRGSRYDIPQELFAPIEQDAVLLKGGERNAAAVAFLEFLKSDQAKNISRSFGYGIE